MTSGRLRGEAGQVAGIETVPFGLVILTVGALLLAHTWAVVDARFVTTAAAREATRAFVEAPSPGVGESRAERAALDVVARSGRAPATLRLHQPPTAFRRCAPVRFDAEMAVPSISLPWRGLRPATVVRSAHTEVVDPYRDDLPGLAACAAGP